MANIDDYMQQNTQAVINEIFEINSILYNTKLSVLSSNANGQTRNHYRAETDSCRFLITNNIVLNIEVSSDVNC
ncbi:hypothetical protein DERP_003434 [Dermatophagoides pteronyssinus]|uniref:Uncharacterized protein n=1 Tax=Dermatophagoides pteronyssinus TaxID=6956 RepID=A0ABQ8JJI8_DERPT|nr:hypothetical protein DERP_003434 [Dermatophagoides pteronyssinus]